VAITNRSGIRRAGVLLAAISSISLLLGSCGIGGSGGSAGIGTFSRSVEKAYTTYTGLLGATPYHFQYLYIPSDIRGAGIISAIAIQHQVGTDPAIDCPGTTIKLSHTNLANLTNTFASNLNTGQGRQVTVVNNRTVSFPAGAAGSWQLIPLDSPFEYNGRDNLVVDMVTGGCTGTEHDAVVVGWPYTAVLYTSSLASATGTNGVWAANMRFVFDGGDDTVAYPVTTGDTAPFSLASAWHHMQVLYKPGDIDGSGPITGVAIISTEAPTDAASYTVNVRMAHTKLAALTDTFDSNHSGKLTTVAKNATFTVPAGVPAGTPIWLPVSGSFKYNGTDNLLLDIEVLSADSTTEWAMDDTTNPDSRAYGAVGATTGYTGAGSYHTVFRFNGAPVYVLTAGGFNNNGIFNGTWSTATLYRASELGSAGKITSVSCRLWFDAVAADYANFKIDMGHATVAGLSLPATDFSDRKTVFAGTVSVPAGFLAGDWIDIPLMHPFSYNGKDNLIVWMGNDGTGPGTATSNSCKAESNSLRFPSGLGYAPTGVDSAAYALYDVSTDLKLEISK
jgi:hypothetical protein